MAIRFFFVSRVGQQSKQVLEFPFPSTPTATALVRAGSRVLTLGGEAGARSGSSLWLLLTQRNSLSPTGPGQAAESLPRSDTNVLMDVNSFRGLV